MDDEQGFILAAMPSPSSSPPPSPNKTPSSVIRQHVTDLINNLSRLVFDCCYTIQEFINNKKNKSLFLSDTNMPLPRTVKYHLTQEPLLLLSATIWRHALDLLHAVEKQLYVSTSLEGYHDDYFIGLGDDFKVRPGAIQHRDTEIVERIYFLERARLSLLEFLSKLYTVVEGFEHPLVSRYQESALFLPNINCLFLELEASMGTISSIGSLSFKELPYQNDVDVSHLSPSDRTEAVRLIYSNLHKLDNYLSSVVTKCHEPMKLGRRWMHYTFGAIGISVLSVWLLRHSRLSVSVDNRVLEAKRSISWFLSDHVVQPLTAIRGGLVNTLRDRHKRVMEQEQEQEQQLTSDLLRRMLLDFGKRRGKKFPPNVPDQELLDMVTGSYEEQLRHPIKNLIMGDLGYAMLIDFLKLKLDIEGVMPALYNQLVRVEESNFIMLTVTALLLYLGARKRSHALAKSRACLKEDIRKRDIKRIAIYEIELLSEAEKYFMQQKEKNTLWSQEHRHYINGLLLSTLDRLYRSAEKYGKESFSWACLQDDIITLGMPSARTWLKHKVIANWKKRQNWLLPLAVP